MILKNSLWRQKTEEKEPGLLEWVKTPYLTSHHTAHSTAPHIPRHRTYQGTAHTMALQYHLTALTSHRNKHPTHPTAPHIRQLCTFRHTAHTTVLHFPPHHNAHPAVPHIPHIPPHSTHFPLHCTCHCQASQSEYISCLETWASTFHRTSLPCMSEDSSTH